MPENSFKIVSMDLETHSYFQLDLKTANSDNSLEAIKA